MPKKLGGGFLKRVVCFALVVLILVVASCPVLAIYPVYSDDGSAVIIDGTYVHKRVPNNDSANEIIASGVGFISVNSSSVYLFSSNPAIKLSSNAMGKIVLSTMDKADETYNVGNYSNIAYIVCFISGSGFTSYFYTSSGALVQGFSCSSGSYPLTYQWIKSQIDSAVTCNHQWERVILGLYEVDEKYWPYLDHYDDVFAYTYVCANCGLYLHKYIYDSGGNIAPDEYPEGWGTGSGEGGGGSTVTPSPDPSPSPEPSTPVTPGDSSSFDQSKLWRYLEDILAVLRSIYNAIFNLEFPEINIGDVTNEAGTNLWDFLISITKNIGDIFDFLGSIVDAIKELGTAIINLGDTIVAALADFVKGLFIPAEGELEGAIDEIQTSFVSQFGVEDFNVSDAFGGEKSPSNSTSGGLSRSGTPSISIGGVNYSGELVNWDYTTDAIATFRPYIRGFIAFLLVLYSINQFLGLIGQPGLAQGIGGIIGSSKRGGDDG